MNLLSPQAMIAITVACAVSTLIAAVLGMNLYRFEIKLLEKIQLNYVRREEFNSMIKDIAELQVEVKGLRRNVHRSNGLLGRLFLKFEIEVPDEDSGE